MAGISTGNGYPLPFENRYALYRAAGFDSIILWWGNDGMATRAARVWLTRVYDLKIEHAHASTNDLNTIWLEGNAGNRTINRLLHEIADCAEFGIHTLAVHLTNGSVPPPITAIGLQRVEHLIRLAETAHVRLAFENLRVPQHTQYILEQYPSSFVGLCYDAGHEHFWTPGVDWLQSYPKRIFAIHLHDNCKDSDAHFIPFDGTIDWERKLADIAASAYNGCITLEAEFRTGGRYEKNGLEAFLRNACLRGREIEAKIQQYRTK